jgi:hypothetical protein
VLDRREDRGGVVLRVVDDEGAAQLTGPTMGP